MKTRHLPRAAGIYWIVNTGNGKMYIGSAVDIQVRMHLHKRALLRNVHHNRKLQHAWNKHGADVFEASVLERVDDPALLIAREQYWFDLVNPVKNGYNIAPVAGSNLGMVVSEEARLKASLTKSRSHPGFISPNGEMVTIRNMRSFCMEHGLTQNVMYMLAQGRATSHKGWTHVNAKRKDREWINTYEGFIDPDGKPVPPITNLEQFSRDRGLDPSSMAKLAGGRIPSHLGWTHVNAARNRRHDPSHWSEYPGWISPEGEQVTIINLRQFCADHGLDAASMWKVMQGKYPQHKGWRYPAGGYQPKARKTQTWRGYISPEGEQVAISNLFQYCKEHDLGDASMYKLRVGKLKSYRGWTYDAALEGNS